MKRFIFQLVTSIFLVFLLLEIVLRVFQLAGSTLPESSINDNRLLTPNASGECVKGGMGEIRSRYKVNNQGWISSIDYSEEIEDSLKIALVGDSYIQGLHTSSDSSIGRQFELMYRQDKIVYEYGRSGGNIVDFYKIYEEFELEKFFKVFILVTDKDLTTKKPAFMGNGKRIKPKNFLRKIYDNIYVIRYLNINQGLYKVLKDIPSKPFKNLQVATKEDIQLDKINLSVINGFGDNVVFLFEDEGLSHEVKELINYPLQPIEPIFLPDNCGFDNHWNLNGRKNCALAMKAYLDEH